MAGVWVTFDLYDDALDGFETEAEARATGLGSVVHYDRATIIDWPDWARYGSKPWEVDRPWPPSDERPVPWHPWTYWARWGTNWSVILTRALGDRYFETFDPATEEWIVTEQDIAYAKGAPVIGGKTSVAEARYRYPWAFPRRPLSEHERMRRAALEVS